MSKRFMITVIALLSALVLAVVVAVVVFVNVNASNNAQDDYDDCMTALGYPPDQLLENTDEDLDQMVEAADICSD